MRNVLMVLLVCLVALTGCAWVSSFFGNPMATTPEGEIIVEPSPAENLLDKIIGVTTPFAQLVPWGGFAAAIAAALQQFLKQRRMSKKLQQTFRPFEATVLAVQRIRDDPATQAIWSAASEWALTKTGLPKETLTTGINEIKKRTGLPIQ